MTTVKTRPKVLGVDLDGTLLQYAASEKLEPPVPGMREQLSAVRTAGWKVSVWTCRPKKQYAVIKDHLATHGIEVDYINHNPFGPPGDSPKEYFDVYLDDKALNFNGDAKGLADKIINFKPWHKQ